MSLRTLTSGRLTLRPLVEGDAAAIVSAINNWEVARWLSAVPYPYALDDALWFIGEIQAGREASYGIFDQDGFCGVIGTGKSDFGYWLAQRAWGKGYATEAGQAVIDAHFGGGGGDLRSGYFVENARSGRVLAKLGFAENGDKVLPSRSNGQDMAARDLILTRAQWAARRDWVRSERLILRPNRPEDVPAMHRIGSHWDVARMTASWPHPADLEFTKSRCSTPYDWRKGIVGAVCLNDRVIGGMGVSETGLGYMIDPDHWGHGFASEIGRATVNAYFDRFPAATEIAAGVLHDNPASMRVLEKIGFERTGTEMMDSHARGGKALGVTFVLTRERWRTLSNHAR